MMVEESRILKVCTFKALQNSLSSVDFDTVLLDVMTIADEVDSQLPLAPHTAHRRSELQAMYARFESRKK